MTRTGTRAFCLLAAAALALGGLPTSSQARTTMPSAGHAVNAADYGCFVLGYSTMTNACSSVKRLETALPIDTGGTYTVKVNAQGPSPSGNVWCEAIGVNEGVTGYWASGQKGLTAFPAAQNIYLSVYVPSGGGLYVYCDVYPNARVNTINW